MNRFQRKRARKRVSDGDVNLAKQTISRRDDLPDEWRDNFSTDDDGIWQWDGTNAELRQVRSAMRDYEKGDAAVYEEKSYYDARRELQYLLNREE